jgi:hypothetical protein
VEAATELAGHLIGTTPRTPEVWSAALALADAVLHEHAVQVARYSLLEASGPPSQGGSPPCSLEDPRRLSPRQNDPAREEAEGITGLLKFLEEYPHLAKNYDEYQRKALSRRGKLIIRLDYMMHEALRLG